jgi:outer membrane protein
MTSRKHLSLPWLLAGAALLVAGAVATDAQSSAPQAADKPLRIAVIDSERILIGSQAGKAAVAELKKLQEAKEAELKAKEQEIADLQRRLQEQRLSLAQDKLAEMQKQLEDKMIAGRRLQDDANRELGKKRDELLGAVDQRVMPLINQVGREMGYTLIFQKFDSGLVYADEAVDITQTVIQRLDAAAPPPAATPGR